MKVTTVRFGADLWALLEEEAARIGVSTSQYIRDAALARATAAAALRGEDPIDRLASHAVQRLARPEPPGETTSDPTPPPLAPQREAAGKVMDAHALSAQSAQALRHAQAVTERSEEVVNRLRRSRGKPGLRG